MTVLKDFSLSLAVLVIMFTALVSEHIHNTQVIEEQHQEIYQKDAQIDDFRYQLGQCRVLVKE
jgi:hypothetical protein